MDGTLVCIYIQIFEIVLLTMIKQIDDLERALKILVI